MVDQRQSSLVLPQNVIELRPEPVFVADLHRKPLVLRQPCEKRSQPLEEILHG